MVDRAKFMIDLPLETGELLLAAYAVANSILEENLASDDERDRIRKEAERAIGVQIPPFPREIAMYAAEGRTPPVIDRHPTSR